MNWGWWGKENRQLDGVRLWQRWLNSTSCTQTVTDRHAKPTSTNYLLQEPAAQYQWEFQGKGRRKGVRARRKEKILTDFRKNIFMSFMKQESSHLGLLGLTTLAGSFTTVGVHDHVALDRPSKCDSAKALLFGHLAEGPWEQIRWKSPQERAPIWAGDMTPPLSSPQLDSHSIVPSATFFPPLAHSGHRPCLPSHILSITLLSSEHHTQCFPRINSSDPHNNPMK